MKRRYLGLVLLTILIIVLVIFVTLRINLEGIGKEYGYVGIFGISFVSCMTIVFPVPYIPALITVAATTSYNPLLIGVFGGLGAAMGEFTGYILGKSGVRAFPDRWKNSVDLAQRYFEKYGFLSIVLVTATPLPVGVMYFAAGVADYSAFKLLLAGVIGKISLVVAMAYVGDVIYPVPYETIMVLLVAAAAVLFLVYILGGIKWIRQIL